MKSYVVNITEIQEASLHIYEIITKLQDLNKFTVNKDRGYLFQDVKAYYLLNVIEQAKHVEQLRTALNEIGIDYECCTEHLYNSLISGKHRDEAKVAQYCAILSSPEVKDMFASSLISLLSNVGN